MQNTTPKRGKSSHPLFRCHSVCVPGCDIVDCIVNLNRQLATRIVGQPDGLLGNCHLIRFNWGDSILNCSAKVLQRFNQTDSIFWKSFRNSIWIPQTARIWSILNWQTPENRRRHRLLSPSKSHNHNRTTSAATTTTTSKVINSSQPKTKQKPDLTHHPLTACLPGKRLSVCYPAA